MEGITQSIGAVSEPLVWPHLEASYVLFPPLTTTTSGGGSQLWGWEAKTNKLCSSSKRNPSGSIDSSKDSDLGRLVDISNDLQHWRYSGLPHTPQKRPLIIPLCTQGSTTGDPHRALRKAAMKRRFTPPRPRPLETSYAMTPWWS